MLNNKELNPSFESRSCDFFDVFTVLVPYVFVFGIKAFIYADLSMWAAVTKGFLILYMLYFIKDPARLFLLIPPLLFLSEQAPTQVGLNEIFLGGSGCILILHSVPYILRSMARSKTVTFSCLIICLFVFLNFVQALRNDIPITDWIRAVTPFLFIGLLWAAKEYIFVNEKNKLLFFSTLLLTIFLFSCRVIFVYFDYHLYKTAWYYLHENVFTLISENDLSLYPSDSVFYFKRRITTILPESTNVLVPLGSVIGSFLFIFTTKKAETVLAILVLLTSMMAVTLTTTRSMILSISVVILMMGFVIVLFYRPYTRRYLLTVSMLIFSPYIISNLVSLNDVYNNRLLVTISGLNNLFYQPSVETQKSKVEDQPSVETQKSKVEDENMNARLEEYKKAFAIFLKNPILGAGFGVKHDMSFDTGHGYILKQRVAYIHNWVLYFLMVGGVVGLLIYSLFLAFPFFTIIRSFRNREYFLIAVTIALLGLYALFFAVFRLISFNIFLALCWGYMLAFNNLKKE